MSEHSETLYEIDYQYKILAEESGVRKFLRTQTVGIHPKFIGQIVEFCHQKNLVENFICPTNVEKCICREVMKKSV